MRDHHRRLSALEARRIQRGDGFHCLQWWPGQSWDDVVARYDGGENIRRGDRVMLIRFAAAGVDDPIQERDAPVAMGWLTERGVADAA